MATDKARDAPSEVGTKFHIDVWLTLVLVNWICDFGRPIAALFVPLKYTPLYYPSIGDVFHFIYNIIVPLCHFKLIERSYLRIPRTLLHLLVTIFAVGASLHLVGDSFNHRLIHLGYQNHLHLTENPLIKNISTCLSQHNPDGGHIVDVFKLVYFYDEYLGHWMWYLPHFTILILVFSSSFVPSSSSQNTLPFAAAILVPIDVLYQWYLITEGQLIEVFLTVQLLMIVIIMYRKFHGQSMDPNGSYWATVNVMTFIYILVWSYFFRHHAILRERYPGLLYVPEPWSVYTLYQAGQL